MSGLLVKIPHSLSLEPIPADLEGGQYVSPILPTSLRYLVFRASNRGGGGGSGGGSGVGSGGGGAVDATKRRKSSTMGGDTRVRVRYNAQLPALSLWDGENSHSILVGTVPLILHGAVICNNWHLCGSFWEECERKRLHIPNPPEVATTVAGILNASRGE